ncbi:MAG: serine/threonine-protein kinase [Myxococcales bacterium]|nr:serine/threonine protein kinase [Myxococcota bacterium]MDW8284079.1 serine/threonine-protein kinase [Myxococcales bacterium]
MSIVRLAGTALARLYRLDGPLAHGARSILYDACHIVSGQRCALKIFHREVVSAERLARCRRDADIVQALHHPALVRAQQWSRPDQLPLAYVSLEFVEGEDLLSRIRRLGRLPPAQVLDIALQAGAVLQAAHKVGVIHRGLTPRNLRCVPSQEAGRPWGRVRVLDFGIAHLPPLPEMGAALMPYLAPELRQGEEGDPRSDQFSLAAILYEALTGCPPPILGRAGTPSVPALGIRCPEAPAPMVHAIERALSPLPSARYGSLEDFLRALEEKGPRPFRTGASARSGGPSRHSALSPVAGRGLGVASRASGSCATPSRASGSGASASSLAPVVVPTRRPAGRRLVPVLVGLALLVGALGVGWLVRPLGVAGIRRAAVEVACPSR